MADKVIIERDGPIVIVTIDRPKVRNAIDRETAALLAAAIHAFEADPEQKVAILTGVGGQFSSGADLKAIARGEGLRMEETGDSPIGVARIRTSKPVIAAVAGYAVAGGMAMALWADMRVVEETAIFGMFDRRFGVPMVGGVTVNLPRLLGLSHAMDLILTGRAVDAQEAFRIGLANRVVPEGEALTKAKELARELADFPWGCLVNDRKALLDSYDMATEAAHRNEFRLGQQVFDSGESQSGAGEFVSGKGKSGEF
ncbi:MAG: crotonase/enoyl-CoA hydratase family protein [Pseudomonadota bacterium]